VMIKYKLWTLLVKLLLSDWLLYVSSSIKWISIWWKCL